MKIMKKMLQKILVLTCVMALFIAPSTALAATEPVCVANTSNCIAYAYYPALHLEQYNG